MKRYAIYIIFLFSFLSVFSQSKSVLDLFRGDRLVANQYYDQMDYRNAIHFYEKVLDKQPDDIESEYKIAKSYLYLNEPNNSEVWLRSLMNDTDATIEMKVLYAEVLRRNGKIEQAKEWYGKILNEENNPEIESKLTFLNHIEEYRRDSAYTIQNVAINSDQSDFSYQPYKERMIFLSARQTERYVKHQPANAINEDEGMLRYFIYDSSQTYHLVYDEEVKPYYHDGPLSFYDENNRVAFTRNNLKDASNTNKGVSKVNLKIFFADCPSDQWKNIEAFEHNSNNYSVGHPTLSSDGSIMFFSSNMPGGFGGPDLYATFRDGNKWSAPVNLGPQINTSGEELFPVLYNDTTLYYSSSGLGGFGGLDIFEASFKENRVYNPRNMGTPINSIADDFSLYMDPSGRKGYFSSNREGGKGLDDIYHFSTVMYTGVVQVVTKQNGNPISGAFVKVESASGDDFWSSLTNEGGGFQINVPYDQDYYVTVSKEGHSDLYKEPFSTKGSRINYDTLVLSLWEHDLYAKGKLYSNETQQLIQDVTVVLENLDNGIKDSVVTTESGTYEFVLVPDNRYKITAKHEGFLPDGFSINTKDIYDGDLLNDIVLEEVYVDKVVTYFGFNETQIADTAYTHLNEIVSTLKRFPKAILNIAAHADSRGSEAYNKRLSEGRLKELVQYFNRKGIAKKRIQGIAFGEELPLNKCSSGVECEEEDYAKNRRAELKVQMHAYH